MPCADSADCRGTSTSGDQQYACQQSRTQTQDYILFKKIKSYLFTNHLIWPKTTSTASICVLSLGNSLITAIKTDKEMLTFSRCPVIMPVGMHAWSAVFPQGLQFQAGRRGSLSAGVLCPLVQTPRAGTHRQICVTVQNCRAWEKENSRLFQGRGKGRGGGRPHDIMVGETIISEDGALCIQEGTKSQSKNGEIYCIYVAR